VSAAGRRGRIVGGLVFVVGLALVFDSVSGAGSTSDGVRPVAVQARPIVDFHPREPGRVRFGALDFLGGLVLTSDDAEFGSFSALRSRDRGRELLSIGDEGTWFTARLVSDEAGRPLSIEGALMARLHDDKGRPLTAKKDSDAESLTLRERDGVLEALVGFERRHRVLVYRSKSGYRGLLEAAGKSLPGQPAELKTLRNNGGLEAIATAPAGTVLSGHTVLLGEEPRPGESDHPGWILGGLRAEPFHVVRRDGFSITDACFLPSGDLLILERRFSWTRGVAMRIRRIAGADIVAGRTIDGEDLIFADGGDEIDNMEGLAVDVAPDGATIVTLISDDNRSWLQRTVLLRFRLRDGAGNSSAD